MYGSIGDAGSGVSFALRALSSDQEVDMLPRSKAKRGGKSQKGVASSSSVAVAKIPLPPINSGKSILLSCIKCTEHVPDQSYFCPHCGTPVLDHILAKTHTTADYDPTSRLLKPWREQVTLPPRVPTRETNFKVTESWKPAMKTGA